MSNSRNLNVAFDYWIYPFPSVLARMKTATLLKTMLVLGFPKMKTSGTDYKPTPKIAIIS